MHPTELRAVAAQRPGNVCELIIVSHGAAIVGAAIAATDIVQVIRFLGDGLARVIISTMVYARCEGKWAGPGGGRMYSFETFV